MRTIRIYEPSAHAIGDTLMLSEANCHHLFTVLKCKSKDPLIIFDGENQEFEARIIQLDKKKISVRLETKTKVSRESPFPIHLAQAVSKGHRMEFVIQKAVELGVASIQPLLTARSVVQLDAQRQAKKLAQWQALLIQACEQCGRNQIPKLYPFFLLSSYLQEAGPPLKWVLDPYADKTWRNYPKTLSSAALLIGPEGGFTDKEQEAIYFSGFQPLHLGPRILRTETATLTALSVLQAQWGDL